MCREGRSAQAGRGGMACAPNPSCGVQQRSASTAQAPSRRCVADRTQGGWTRAGPERRGRDGRDL